MGGQHAKVSGQQAADSTEPTASREMKGLHNRQGQLQILKLGKIEEDGRRSTRSRSRTPVPTPANMERALAASVATGAPSPDPERTEAEAEGGLLLNNLNALGNHSMANGRAAEGKPANGVALALPGGAENGKPPPAKKRPNRKGQESGLVPGTGQALNDQAVAGIVKALGRRQKRADRQANDRPTTAAAAVAQSTKSAEQPKKKPASKRKATPRDTDGASTEPDNNFGEGPSTATAPPTPKRTRIAPAIAFGEEDEDILSEEGSDADGEWEPDWQSEDGNKDDDLIIDLTQEESDLATEALEGGLLALKEAEVVTTGQKGRKPAKPRAKRKKDAGNKEDKKTSDDEIWAAYGSDMELDGPYVPKALQQMEAPAELLMELLPYQKEFLAWAVSQERGDICGGILADEMGMGKTIQAISVILTHRTDDNSKLPQLVSADDAKGKGTTAKETKRPKLRLQNAPPKPDQAAPVVATPAIEAATRLDTTAAEGPGPDAEEDWEDVAVAEQLHSTASGAVIHKEDTVAPDLVADNANLALAGLAAAPSLLAGLDAAPSLQGPDAVIPAPERPPHLHTMMAVGESGCGTKNAAVAAPSGDFCRATLVICPLVAVIQWRQEIARYTAPGTLKVVVYHGNKRATTKEELEDADVVLTTYSIVEGEYRRHTQPNKATCIYCSKKFYPDRLKVHLRFFCGPNAKKSAALAKQQKKRPRKDAAAADEDSDEDRGDSEAEDDSEEMDPNSPPKKKRPAAKGKSIGKAAGKNPGKAVLTKTGKKGKAAAEEDGRKGKSVAAPKGKAKGLLKSAGKGAKPASAVKGKAASKRSPAKPKKKLRKGDDDDDSGDSDFSAGKESDSESALSDSDEPTEDEESDEEGPSTARIKPRRVRNASGWGARALAEAEEMIAASESKNSTAADVGKSILHEVKWRRITLDEAHSIKDRRCSTAKAVFALDSKYKWALSGTPLQNRVSELYSLVRFLRLFPYAYYFCNNGHSKTSQMKAGNERCSCRSLDYSFRTNWRKCDHCGHSPLHHYCYWNKWVANPIKKFGYVGKGRAAMRLLKHEILEKILLRRTKVQCADVLALPPRTVVLRKDRFDEREEDFYEALYTQSQAQFDAYVQTATVLNNYAHVFSLLVRLRQAVNHPYLVVHSSTAPAAAEGAPAGQQEGDCNICHDPLEDGVAAACGHAFCRACITDFLETATGAACCTACDKPLTIDLANAVPAAGSRVAGSRKDSIINRISLANFQSSTKIEALREELERMLQRDPSGKALVFSQFTSMLDLIAFRLQQVGIKVVRLEGSMAMQQRDRMIEAFTTDASVRVFLMSLKAGGVALNLTAASHVMLMDPWWNPAVEQQAQDRIHRLGQFKPIHVTRFVIGGTIEERILKLQEKKQLVFEGTVGRDSDALGRLTEDDLRFLFG